MINNQTSVESIRFRNFIFESIRIFLKIVHHFEILKAKLQLMLKDILRKLKIFTSWNLDRVSVIEREFLKIVHHCEILKASMDAERYFRKFKDFCFLEFGSRIWQDLNISEDCTPF